MVCPSGHQATGGRHRNVWYPCLLGGRNFEGGILRGQQGENCGGKIVGGNL